MQQTAASQIADAEAENYWSTRAKRNQSRREYLSRRICCLCKIRPVQNKPNAAVCKTDADEYRRLFGSEID